VLREPLPPPPRPLGGAGEERPHAVPPSVLDQNRIPDRIQTAPDAATRAEMASAGVKRAVGVFKLCVDTTGAVSEIKPIKSTGFPAYDRKIESELRRSRYRPIEVDGKVTPICTSITFIYTGSSDESSAAGSGATP
jgi:hypothetical protein